MSSKVAFVALLAVLCLFTCLVTRGPLESQASPVYSQRVFKEARLAVTMYGEFSDTFYVSGTCDMTWSDTVNVGGYYEIQIEIVDLDLAGEGDSGAARVLKWDMCTGLSRGQTPGDVFPANAYYDLFITLEFYDALPGEVFHNEDPLRIESVIDEMPPYFDLFEGPTSTGVILYDEFGTARGEITYWQEEAIPYAPPEAHIFIPTPYGGEVPHFALDTLMVMAAMSGETIPEEAVFSYRPAGSTDPFTIFWVDDDGTAPNPDYYDPMNRGDGWSGYLDISLFDPVGAYYEFEVCFDAPPSGTLCDTITVFVDPTPPLPSFSEFRKDSIGFLRSDSLYVFSIQTEDEDAELCRTRRTRKYDYYLIRFLDCINMTGLGGTNPRLNMYSCGPVSAACCLKCFADHGYPALKYPHGDTTRTAMNGKSMSRELRTKMGTRRESGTPVRNMLAGIKSYLRSHGMKVGSNDPKKWSVKYIDIENFDSFLASMIKEFRLEKEDVILHLVDTVTVNGRKEAVGHYVTMSYMKARCYKVKYPDGHEEEEIWFEIGFMDPAGGVIRKYNVQPCVDEPFLPRIVGYKIDPFSTRDALIRGFFSVSPPSESGEEGRFLLAACEGDTPGSGSSTRCLKSALADSDWVLLDSHTANGPGMPDTLYWDTTGLPGGIYLLCAEYIDATGRACSVLRLCGIPEFTTGEEEKVPSWGSRIDCTYPNPFNPTTTIEFTLARPSEVTMAVYDVAGRRIRLLMDGRLLGKGRHIITWDGRNESGSLVASGVYFCRMVTRDGVSMAKIALVR